MEKIAGAFLMESLFGENPINTNFFTPFEEQNICSSCRHNTFILRKTKKGKLWCPFCYINKFCLVKYYYNGFMIYTKGSQRLLFSSIPLSIEDDECIDKN
jgi:hypothetical protein